MDVVAAAREYLGECFGSGHVPRASELATRLGMSPWGLTRAFARDAGLPPSRFLKREQVMRALVLLRDTALPVATVARQTGFGSARSLHRAFQRLTSATPRAACRARKP